MKKLFLIFLFLLIACPAWATSYFPFVAGQEEVRTYFALPNPTGTVKDLNEEIKTLKTGGVVTYNNVTADIANYIPYYFISNPSIDLRKYIGNFITLSSGGYSLKIYALSAGTGQTYSTEKLSADGTFTANTGWAGLINGWNVSGGLLNSVNSYGATYGTESSIQSLYLVKLSFDMTRTAGNLKTKSGANSGYRFVSNDNGRKSFYFTQEGSDYVYFYKDTENFSGTIDNVNVVVVYTPSATGITHYQVSVDAGFPYQATSYTAVIERPTATINFLALGDSKTYQNPSLTIFQTYLRSTQTTTYVNHTDGGVSGSSIAGRASTIDAYLASITMAHTHVIMNFGVNDWASSMPNETTWKTNYQYIISAIHTKWPNAKIYITKPWNRGHDVDAVTMAGWIDALIAANPSFVYVGHNESIWLKGADDGATMTEDGTHYSDAGETECANQWKTILGY